MFIKYVCGNNGLLLSEKKAFIIKDAFINTIAKIMVSY